MGYVKICDALYHEIDVTNKPEFFSMHDMSIHQPIIYVKLFCYQLKQKQKRKTLQGEFFYLATRTENKQLHKNMQYMKKG